MIIEELSKEFDMDNKEVNNTISLIDEGNTLPFIAHYRKSLTGNLNNKNLIKFKKMLVFLRSLDAKKKEVLKIISSMDSDDNIDAELKESIENAKNFAELDDISTPFINQDETLSSIAKSKGLNPLANIIRFQQTEIPIEEIAKDFIDENKGINNIEDAITGAKDIIAHIISNNIHFRSLIRKITYEEGKIKTTAVDDSAESHFELYYDHDEAIIDISNHRILAINRGEKEGFLKVKIIAPEEEIIEYLIRHILVDISSNATGKYNEITKPFVEEAVEDAYYNLIAPSIELELRDYLTQKAENQSIEIFSLNLESLLMQKPIRNKVVLGWNASLYDASRIAIVDGNGEVLKTDWVYLSDIEELKTTIKYLIKEYDVDLIALGSFSDSNKFETVISEIIDGTKVEYAVINQAGASEFYQGLFGDMEFPDYELGHRIAISIARRLQDPLSELVKVDPKVIGVGQYQHDMNQEKLINSLSDTIELVVNDVGVDVNKASFSLLVNVSGIDSVVAKNIIDYIKDNGPFTSREELLNVEGMTDEIFKQSAGFLRIHTDNENINKTITKTITTNINTTNTNTNSNNVNSTNNNKTIENNEKFNENKSNNENKTSTENINDSNNSKSVKRSTTNYDNLTDNFKKFYNKFSDNFDSDNSKPEPEVNSSKSVSTKSESVTTKSDPISTKLESVSTKSEVSDIKIEPNIYDSTAIHPESYEITDQLLKELNITKKDIGTKRVSLAEIKFTHMAQRLNSDEYTIKDIAINLKNPNADSRDFMSHVMLRKKPLTIGDLKPNMELEGIVRNVVDFGAFIDLGIYHDGLVHISKMNHGQFVNHPSDIVSVGDKVKVRVLEVDRDKNRIQLYLL
ncbi:MAG: helix-hairpin-helix domain-containing protein [Methanobrevibacter sp.]|nr:helix-hairpin-helix domain-containing protein [Candidatus Methanoflexus mossambicus]